MSFIASTHASAGSWLARRRRAALDTAAQRAYDRLVADPATFRTAPSSRAALALAVVVLLGFAALGVLDVVAAVVVHLWWRWLLVLVAVAVAVAVRPRNRPISGRSRILPPEQFPGVHRLVGTLSGLMGVKAPAAIAVSYDINAWVQPFGWSGRPALVIGMPLWCMDTPNERVAVLCHELGHLRNRDLRSGRVVNDALRLLDRLIVTLRPLEVGHALDRRSFTAGRIGIAARIATVVQTLLSLPFQLLYLMLVKLEARSSQHDEYLADRRSAAVAGTTAMRQSLSTDAKGTWTRVAAAVRRGLDPFAEFTAIEPPSEDRIAAHVRSSQIESIRADASHPPDHLRIALLEASFAAPGTGLPSREVMAAAELEMLALQRSMSKRMADLLTTRYYR